VLLALLDPLPASAHPGRFDVTRDTAGFYIEATADLEASQELVWETLTDYENLPRFVPGIRSVRVLQTRDDADGQRLVIEQSGEVRFLSFSRRVDVLLDVVQRRPNRIEARALPKARVADSDVAVLTDFQGTYFLAPIPGGVRLRYHAHVAPDFALPAFLGGFAVRRTMQAQFEAMLAEIDRRRLAVASQGSSR
jgi:uncharacterized membrane protein